MTTRFICGCESKIDPPITRETLKAFDSIVEDSQGHLVCLVHHERLYGWRSVPYRYLVTASMTPLEYERWIIFGEKPKRRHVEISERVPDLRDNRDPEQVGNEYLAAIAVAKNGQLTLDIQDQTWTPTGGSNTTWH